MRVFLGLVAVLLAGCAGGPAPSLLDSAPSTDSTAEVPLIPTAEDLRAVADADAVRWNPAARLILIAAFEGDIPDFGSAPLPASDPWVGPFRAAGDAMLGDGRSPVWSFSYTVDDEVSQAAMATCDLGQHAELREAHVVTVDRDGNVVASYESRNDDEGATTTGWLPDGLIGSAQAAAAAEADLRMPRSQATYSRTFLATEWFYEQPAWVFQLENEERRWFVGVDATSGEVLQEPAPPRC